MNTVLEYIKYRWKSKGRHGTHSPFVYTFVDQCLPTTIKKETKQQLKYFISRLEKNKSTIKITDLGAGSKKMGTTRKICQIAKNSSSKGKYGVLLNKLANFYPIHSTLELGTSVGIGTAHLAINLPNNQVVTVEGCPNTHLVAKEQFDFLNLKNIEAIQSDFKSYLNNEKRIFDLIYLDGHHVGSAVLEYVELLQKNMHDETLLIVDDIYWSEGMNQAWKTLINDQRFHCTMDLWRMGIIVKRPHQVKEHFIVKY